MTTPKLLLLVRFKSSLSYEEITEVVEKRIHEYVALAGLQQKYYLHDPDTGEFAGLYVWRSPEDLAEFQKSDLRASIAEAYKVIGEPRIEVYQVARVLREGEGA
jgi:hypothetical protein